MSKGPVLTQAAPPEIPRPVAKTQENQQQSIPQEVIGLLPGPTEVRLAYEPPELTELPAFPLQMTLTEGMRINYASPEVVETLLDYGYIELEAQVQGRTILHTIKKSHHQFTYAYTYAGELVAHAPMTQRRMIDMMARVDIHAFHWYSYSFL